MTHTNINRAVIGFNGRRVDGVVIAERFEARRGRERRILTIRTADGLLDIDGRWVDFDFEFAGPEPIVEMLGR
jgi:hypothetical protein